MDVYPIVLNQKHWRGDLSVAAQLQLPFSNEKLVRPKQVMWSFPPQGWCKLNCNGASRGNRGKSGAGGLIRDHGGKVMVAFYEFLGLNRSIYAELFAVYWGMQLALDLGIQKLKVEMDASTRLKIIYSTTRGNWKLQHLLIQIRNMQVEMETDFAHIHRSRAIKQRITWRMKLVTENPMV
ncbi:UNVERIFIED_CONTAM: hypothetical protein Slati_0862200 [Sesamum latifolium]|uniref:RNase H type-1 domain-containing protein n=1 Tax=Sesamum latifolium TaxID=2727402 RepID=A0AAW2XMG6_9LAMI